MTIRFLCPYGHKLAVPDELAGKKGRCPECNQRVYIPYADSQRNEPAAYATEGQAVEAAAAEGAAERQDFALEDDDLLALHEGGSVGPGQIMPSAGAPSDAPQQQAPEWGSPPSSPSEPWAENPPVASVPPEPETSGHTAGPAPAQINIPDLPPPALPFTEAEVRTEEPEGYVPDAGKVQTVYMLAVALAGFTAFAAAPALKHINLIDAPWWARVVLILSAIQVAYIAWMVSLPDWSTVWIGMVVFALVAAAYGVACGIIVVTPEAEAINFLDLDGPPDDPDFRKRVAAWCFVMLLLCTMLTYACGRFSGKWRKQYEIAKASRERRAES